jgi:hypothetical protein
MSFWPNQETHLLVFSHCSVQRRTTATSNSTIMSCEVSNVATNSYTEIVFASANALREEVVYMTLSLGSGPSLH